MPENLNIPTGDIEYYLHHHLDKLQRIDVPFAQKKSDEKTDLEVQDQIEHYFGLSSSRRNLKIEGYVVVFFL